MITILLFTDDDADAESLAIIGRARGMHSALWDLDQYFRSEVKYGEDSQRADAMEAAREKLHELLADNDVSLD